MKKLLSLATAILTVSTLCSVIALPVSASTKPATVENSIVKVEIDAAAKYSDADEYYAAYKFVSNALRQIGIYNTMTYIRETNIYINSDYTACDYLDKLFCSREFNTRTYRMDDETYVKTVYRIVLNRLPSSAELNQALKFMKVRTSDHVLVNGFIVERAYVGQAFYLAYPELDYGNAHSDDYIWNMW